MKTLNKILGKIFTHIDADAHCDIPCGIYEPTPAKIAAKTVLRMTEQLETLTLPKDVNNAHDSLHYASAVARRTGVKETHAELCKREIETLWSDFFKPEHIEKFPDLHTTVWQTLKLASKCKQENSIENAQRLVAQVDEIAKVFYEVKGVPERFKAYQELTDKLY